jgi:LuxR family maltose regulon positive regulatory protein
MACFQGNPASAVELSRRALSLLPEDDFVLRGTLASNIALNLGDALSSSSDIEFADQVYSEAVRAGRASGDKHLLAISLNRQGEIQALRGHLHEAERSYRQTLDTLRLPSASRAETEDWSLFEEGMARLGLSELAYEWNDLYGAGDYLETGIALVGQEYRDRSIVMEHQARVQLALGHEQDALRIMQQAVDAASSSSVSWLVTRAEAAQARLWLMIGNVEAAVRWAQVNGLSIGNEIGFNREDEYVTQARVLLAQGKVDQTLALLDWLLGVVEKVGLTRSHIQILSIKAMAFQSRGDKEFAISSLKKALRLAEREGFVRTFIDEGQPMANLLQKARSLDLAVDYTDKLLAAWEAQEKSLAPTTPRPVTQGFVDPLSDRELEVLRLLAADLTGPEIASELTIALSTVRSHIKKIYEKLDVHSRYEAVYRAKELKLI